MYFSYLYLSSRANYLDVGSDHSRKSQDPLLGSLHHYPDAHLDCPNKILSISIHLSKSFSQQLDKQDSQRMMKIRSFCEEYSSKINLVDRVIAGLSM